MLTQTVVTLGGLAGLLVGHWYLLTRYLDARFAAVDARFAEMDRRFNQIETRIIRIEDTFLKDYGERIARLERTH